MSPLPASAALDAYFLEARSKILDLAAIFDRISRGGGTEQIAADPRAERLKRAVDTLLRSEDARAERVQEIFSLEYDPNWPRPEPR